MKSRTTLSLAILILAGLALATEPSATPDNHPEATLAVQTRILPHLERSFPPFSRLAPPRPKATFSQMVVTNGEKRLPFEVTETRSRLPVPGTEPPRGAVLVSGYVRLSDNAVFVLDTATMKHIPAELDPRFAPPGKGTEDGRPE
jgi:hypothetical protein